MRKGYKYKTTEQRRRINLNYYYRHRDECLERVKTYRADITSQNSKETLHEYYESHKDKIKSYMKEYYRSHKEELKVKRRIYLLKKKSAHN